MKFPSFVGGTNQTFSTMGDCQRTINLYPAIIGVDGKNRIVLRGTPGIVELFTLAGKSKVRGMFHGDLAGTGYIYAAIDDHLYKVKSDGSTSTDLGALSSATAPIKWATGGSGQDTLVVSNGVAYSLVSGTLAAISDLSAITATSCASMNNFWIIGLANGRFMISALNDVTSWDALDYEVSDDTSEPVLGIAVSNHQVWFIGRTRANIWYYSNASSFPFSQMKGAQIRYGLQAVDSLAIADNAIVWLAQSADGANMVVASRSYAPQVISTPAIEAAIAALTTTSDAIGFPYTEDGQSFYVLNFPTGDLTIVYDFAIGLWTERDSLIGGAYHAHLANCHIMEGGNHLIGSRSSGTIYTMSNSVYTDDGAAIRRLRRCPHLGQENKQILYPRFELDLEKGLGAVGSLPTADLRWSDDGGKTWTNPLSASIGEIGDYKRVVAWNRLGYGRDRVFEVSSTAAIRHCWTDAYLEIGR